MVSGSTQDDVISIQVVNINLNVAAIRVQVVIGHYEADASGGDAY